MTDVDVMKRVLKEKAMGKPIKRRRIDIMTVLKNHEIRISVLEKGLYSIVQSLTTLAQGDNNEGGLGSESERQTGTNETSIESSSSASDDLRIESDGAGSEEVRAVQLEGEQGSGDDLRGSRHEAPSGVS